MKALDPRLPAIIITEGPFDALALAAAGYPALAIMGGDGPAWLARACAVHHSRLVFIATDADAAGDAAAEKLAALLGPSGAGAKCGRLRPPIGKDWNDTLLAIGREALSDHLAERVLIGRAELAEWETASFEETDLAEWDAVLWTPSRFTSGLMSGGSRKLKGAANQAGRHRPTHRPRPHRSRNHRSRNTWTPKHGTPKHGRPNRNPEAERWNQGGSPNPEPDPNELPHHERHRHGHPDAGAARRSLTSHIEPCMLVAAERADGHGTTATAEPATKGACHPMRYPTYQHRSFAQDLRAIMPKILKWEAETEARKAAEAAEADRRHELAEAGGYVWLCFWHRGTPPADRAGMSVYEWRRQHRRELFTLKPKAERPTCGARTRAGGSCRAKVVVRADGRLSRRCRFHGGLSSGAKTDAGREAIRASNRRRGEARRAQ